MQPGTKIAFIVCLTVTVGLVAVQGFWVQHFFALNKNRFGQEVNLAFEDALKREFTKRNDSIEGLLFQYIMDSSNIRLTSKRNPKDGRQMYQVINASNPKDYFSFSRKELDFPLTSQSDTNRWKIARAVARLDREQDLNNHIIFYRTQNIGHYLTGRVEELSFDTARLRPFLQQTLAERNINEPFVFGLKDEDNMLNRNRFPDSVTRAHPIITKAFPTFKNTKGQNYVRAYFPAPTNYLLAKSAGLLLASGLLLVVVAVAFLYLIRIIQREKKLSAIKNDFVNHITHEFKTPIATVYTAVQALEGMDTAANPVKTKRYLNLSKAALERLSELVNKVLHISLYEQPHFQMNCAAVDLNMLVAEVVDIHRSTIEHADALNFEKGAGEITVWGDRSHLHNAISNLLDNAIKYSGNQPHVNITLSMEKDWAVLSVQDNGPGIAKEEQELVFEKFYRSASQRNVKGFGLGLSYLRDVAQKHKGWCRVDSKRGEGSIFYMGLPVLHA